MSDDDESDHKEVSVEGAINAITGLVKAVPVYDEVVQPAAKEVGKSLETVAKVVNVALAPLRMLVWGYESFRFSIFENTASLVTMGFCPISGKQ